VTDISPLVAFLAGVLSFLSPCVLPLVPGYLSLMSGVSVEKLKQGEGTGRAVLANALLFVLGFSVVFVAMGASASAVGAFLNEYRSILFKIAGVIIILFGVFLLGLVKLSWLYRDVRYQGALNPGKLGTFLLGIAFAFGWTPCIGPILGALLLLAATKETVAQGVFLLAVYSAGLGMPFLLTALGLNSFLSFYQGFRRYLQWVERAAGVLLIAVGLLVATNQLTWLAGYFAFLNQFSPENLLAAPKPAAAAVVSQLPPDERPLAPDLTMTRADGTIVKLSELRGHVVVLNFWATWCGPCRLEIPFFNKVYQETRSRGVEFVGLSTDDGGWPDINKFLKEQPIDYLVVHDATHAAGDQVGGLPGLPVTIFIDRQGRIAGRHIGITDIDVLRENIEALL